MMNRNEKAKLIDENSDEVFELKIVRKETMTLGQCWKLINEILSRGDGDEVPVEKISKKACREMLKLYVDAQQYYGDRFDWDDLQIYWDNHCDSDKYKALYKLKYGNLG